jgi:hypothetical protein
MCRHAFLLALRMPSAATTVWIVYAYRCVGCGALFLAEDA